MVILKNNIFAKLVLKSINKNIFINDLLTYKDILLFFYEKGHKRKKNYTIKRGVLNPMASS